ncbi:MAG: hypothetical protein M3Q58_10245 [Bacteroidota bacterium]|nr:hypothetical protein [Bacteroidota bacterium]
MSIFLNNYESWFLDYHEGNLNENQKELLFRFLEQNPKFLEEFNSFDNTIVINENFASLETKEQLKAPQANNFDELLIAYLEDNLNDQEKKKIEELINNNKKIEADFSLFKKTLLSPDLSIVYPKKKNLKKEKRGVIRLMYYASVAAAACFLFFIINMNGLFQFNNSENQIVNGSSDSLKSKNISLANTIKEPIQLPEEIKEQKNESIEIAEIKEKKIKKAAKILTKEEEYKEQEKVKQPLLSEEKSSLAIYTKTEDLISESQNEIPNETLISSNQALIDTTSKSTKENEKFLTPKELLLQHLKNAIAIIPDKEIENSNKLSLWEIADAGTNNISKITGRELKISRELNEKGSVSLFAIITDRFEFSHSSSK